MISEHSYIKRSLIILQIICLVLLVIYGYLFYDIRSKTRKSVTLLHTLQDSTQNNNRLEEIEQVLENVSERASDIDSFVLNDDGIVKFLEVIEELALEQNIIIEKRIQKIENGIGPRLHLTLTTEGSWQATQNFLALMENLQYSIEMIKFSNRLSEDGEVWLGSIEFSVISNS